MCMCLLLQSRYLVMSVAEKGFEERTATVFEKEKTPNCGNVDNQLFNKLNISGVFLLLFSQMPGKMTKFGLTDMFENMKLFLKRASGSDQIKSSMFFSLQFIHSIRWGVTLCYQKSTSFRLSFPRKAENAFAFLHILSTSRKKTKGQKYLQNSSFSQASFIIVPK